MIAKLAHGCSEAASLTGISVVWRRIPITTVTIALVIAVWTYDYLSVSSADSATLRSSVAVEHVPRVPFKRLPSSHPSARRTETGRAQDAKATLPAFRRIRVGQNEVDYIAEDVTVRLFQPRPTPMRVPHLNRELNIGEDVTVRYFEHEPALTPQRRPASAAAQSVERSLLVSK